MPTPEGHGDCTACGALCCRYITIEIEKPTRKADVDEIRWFLAHEDVEVFIEDGDWYVQVNTRCKHLTTDNRCAIYEDRFQVCRDHDPKECEASDGEVEAVIFRTTEEFDAYWARKKPRRAKRRKKRTGSKTAAKP